MKISVKNKLSSISVLIPTLNAGSVLEGCLESIAFQDYPKEKIEIIVADGGSSDNTLGVVKKFQISNFKFQIKVVNNPLKTGEAGKAVALRYAQGELVALIDSDNILPDKNWLKVMIEPFGDRDVLGSEPWEFTYRKEDTYINRYCALIGMNDPYCYFVGNYDRFSQISGKWTGLKVAQVDKGKYIKVKIEGKTLPTIGANGTIWRAEVLKKAIGKNNYLFDTDIPYTIARDDPFYFAKVKTGIIHLYCKRLNDFYRKQRRRAKDFFYLEKKGNRTKTFQRRFGKQVAFILSTIFVLPLLFQAMKGYIRKPDWAWFFHPIACIISLWLYGSETIISKIKTVEMSRKDWKQ